MNFKWISISIIAIFILLLTTNENFARRERGEDDSDTDYLIAGGLAEVILLFPPFPDTSMMFIATPESGAGTITFASFFKKSKNPYFCPSLGAGVLRQRETYGYPPIYNDWHYDMGVAAGMTLRLGRNRGLRISAGGVYAVRQKEVNPYLAIGWGWSSRSQPYLRTK